MLNIVTIVCDRDYEVFELQLESIIKFVYEFTHWIILNEEDNLNFEKWKNLIEKYYKDKNLYRIFILENFIEVKKCSDGWKRQQGLKLLISRYIENDYLILNSKNFFIRNSSHIEWKNSIGCGSVSLASKLTDNDYPSKQSLHNYSKYFNKKPLDIFLTTNTPFYIQKKYIDEHKITQEAIDILLNEKKPSEFLFYSYLINDELLHDRIKNIKHKTFWHQDLAKDCNLLHDLLTAYAVNNNVIFGFHRQFLALIQDDSEIEEINFFLKHIGFNFRLNKNITRKMLEPLLYGLKAHKNLRVDFSNKHLKQRLLNSTEFNFKNPATS